MMYPPGDDDDDDDDALVDGHGMGGNEDASFHHTPLPPLTPPLLSHVFSLSRIPLVSPLLSYLTPLSSSLSYLFLPPPPLQTNTASAAVALAEAARTTVASCATRVLASFSSVTSRDAPELTTRSAQPYYYPLPLPCILSLYLIFYFISYISPSDLCVDHLPRAHGRRRTGWGWW